MPLNIPGLDVVKSVFGLGEKWVEGREKRKLQKDQQKFEIRELQHDLKKTQITADIDRTKSNDSKDFDYDQQVLRNRERSIIDEVLIIFFMAIFAMHFIPSLQTYMLKGWEAMEAAPFFFHFTIIGIVISTLGLMRLFRLMVEMKRDVFKTKGISNGRESN